MPTLRELADRIGKLSAERARLHFRVSRAVKILIVLAAGGAAVAESVELAHAAGATSTWTVVAIAAAVLVALGGLFLTFTEQDASTALETARDAVERARDYNDEIERFQRVRSGVRRVSELYIATNAMREAISLSVPNFETVRVIESCLQVAKRSLLIAFGFALEDHWTIGIYVAEKDALGKNQLRLIAHDRSIQCDIKDGRMWPEGVGVAGIALAKSAEVIVPDLLDPAVGSTFDLGSLAKEGDRERYRSIAAVPIRSGIESTAWGVVLATSDRPRHFEAKGRIGIQNAEPLRALAGMIELVIRLAPNLTRCAKNAAVPGIETRELAINSTGGAQK
jgi:hypothetical protein